MATQKRNIAMHGLSGNLNGQLLFKQYPYGTVVSKIPDRSKVILSEKQKAGNATFRQAVRYAKQVLGDPVKYAEYQSRLPEGKSVYHAAIAEYFAGKEKG